MLKKILYITLLLFVLSLSSCIETKTVIYFDFNNGSKISKIKIKNHDDIYSIEIPNRDRFTYEKWYIDSNLETPLSYNHSLKEIKVLYLKWIENNIDLKNNFLSTFNKSLENHHSINNYEVISRGTAKASMANQEIYSKKIVNDKYFYLFNASYGLAKTFVQLEKKQEKYVLKTGEPDKTFNINKIIKNEEITLNNYH